MGFHESGFDPNAVSSAGARGVMQFMPATAQEYGIDPHDTPAAINAAGKKMSGLINYYKGDISKAIAAYNFGEGNVDKTIARAGNNWQDELPPETQVYLSRILGGQEATTTQANTDNQYTDNADQISNYDQSNDQQTLASDNNNSLASGLESINTLENPYLSNQAENQNGSQESTSETQNANAQEEGLLNTDAPEQSGVTSIVDNAPHDPLVSVIDRNTGTAFNVLQSDLESDKDKLTKHSVKTGKRLLTPILRQDIVDEQTYQQELTDQQKRQNEQTNQQTETQTQDQTGADQSTAVTPSYATAPLLNKRTNKPFKTRKMAEAAIASSSNPTLNKQDHIAVPVDGGFGIAPKPNTTQESNDTTAETQSVLSNTGTNAKGITAPATTDATGQGSTQTAQEVDKQPWQMTHDEYWKAEDKKYEANRLDRLAKVNNELDTLKNKGEGYDAIIAKEIGKVPHTITNDGKFSHNLRSGSYKHNNAHEFVVRQLLKRRKSIESSSGRFRNSFVNDNKNHHAAIQKAIDEGQTIPKNVLDSLPSNFPEFKSDATAQATETVTQAQVFGNLSNNEQSNKESQQNTQSIIPKDSKKLGLAITRAAKIDNRSFNDMPGMYSQGSEHQGIDIHSINQTKDINGNPDYIIHVSNRTRVAANGHKTTEGKYSLNALLNSGAISQKTHDFLVNEHNQNINAATETNNDHELTATQYVDRESKGFTANKQINDSLRKAHYTAIRSHLDQGGKISQEVFDSLDGLQRSNLNKNYGEDIIQSPAQEVAKKPDWEMTRDEYKNSFDPRDYKDSNYDRMIRGAVFNEKITQAEADKKLIRDYHGNKYHWAKTRKELEQEKKEAVKNAKAARAEGNKNPIHSVKWAQKSESNTAKNNITSTNLYHNKLLEVHQERVQEALSEGKPVPQEVLADYPNLQKPAQETANPINDNADVSKKGENAPSLVNWRTAFKNASDDVFKQNDILRGIADISKSASELDDVVNLLAKIKKDHGLDVASTAYAVFVNKYSSKEAKQKSDDMSEHMRPAKKGENVDTYHPAIKSLASDLIIGGGVGIVTDKNDVITGRTPSLNPEWFKDGAFITLDDKGNQTKDKSSVKDIQTAVDDYYAGKRLTPKQKRILSSLSNVAHELEQAGNNSHPEYYDYEQSLLDNDLQSKLVNNEISIDDVQSALDQFDDSIPFDVKGDNLSIQQLDDFFGITNEERKSERSATGDTQEALTGYPEAELATKEREQKQRDSQATDQAIADKQSPEHLKAQADFKEALSDVGIALSDKTSFNAVPSEVDLEKAVKRLVLAAFKLGYIKLSDNVNHVIEKLKAKFGNAAAHIDEPYISKIFDDVKKDLEGRNAVTGDLNRVNKDVRDAVNEFLSRRPIEEQTRIKDNLNAHSGTAWAAAAVKGMAYREMLHRAMEGRSIDNLTTNDIWGGQNMANTKIIKAFKQYIRFGDKAIHSLINQYDFIGGNRKAENDVSTSFANCNPSDECAVHCYAAGSNARPNEIAKSEFTEFVLENYLKDVADRIALTYRMKQAGVAGLSLRLNDKGDLSEAQVQLISKLNDKDIVLQIFSKRPDLLRKIPDANLKMLSIDSSNMAIAKENPGLRLAVVITDGMTEAMLEPLHDRVSVYLPVNLKGKSVSTEELKSRFPNLYPKMKRDNLCPVDGGGMATLPGTSFVDIKNGINKDAKEKVWTCTACDLYGAAGCFNGDRQTIQRNAATQAQNIQLSDVKKEVAIKNAKIELQKQLDLLTQLGEINGKQHEEISGILSSGRSDIRIDVNRGAETGDLQKTSSVSSGQQESGGRTGRDDNGRGETGRVSGESKEVKFSKSNTPVTNPHSKTSLNQAITNAMDSLFGKGWTHRLMATDKFKLINSSEAVLIAGNKAIDAKGFYNYADDTTYLVHDNMDKALSDKALQGLILHEIGAHALRLGQSHEIFQDILRRFELLKKTNIKVQAAFDSVPKGTKPEDIVEEALAHYVEENPTASLAQQFIEWFRQAVRAIGKALVGKDQFLFSQWTNKLTEVELIDMVASALRSAPDSIQFDNVGRKSEAMMSKDKSVINLDNYPSISERIAWYMLKYY